MGWSFDLYGREKWDTGSWRKNRNQNIEFYKKQPTSLDKIPCGYTMDAMLYGWDWQNMSLRDRLAGEKKRTDELANMCAFAFPIWDKQKAEKAAKKAAELNDEQPGATNSTLASAPTIAAMEIEGASTTTTNTTNC